MPSNSSAMQTPDSQPPGPSVIVEGDIKCNSSLISCAAPNTRAVTKNYR